jgi:hypothetical protein
MEITLRITSVEILMPFEELRKEDAQLRILNNLTDIISKYQLLASMVTQMLNSVIMDVIRNRDEKLHGIRDHAFDKILDTARSNWIEYQPSSRKVNIIGIDSSWNSKSYQGLDMYVVDAVAMDSHNNLLGAKHEHDIRPIKDTHLQNLALAMELELCEQVLEEDNSRIICLDGSLESKIIQASGTAKNQLIKLLDSQDIFYISKNSVTNSYFGLMQAKLGDIYYFNHVGKKSGFSFPPSISIQYSNEFGIIAETFVRLKESTPMLKIELAVGKKIDRKIDALFMKNLLDILSYYSIAGYPQCLEYAHETCEIKNSDMAEIAGIYGMKDEIGARALLKG